MELDVNFVQRVPLLGIDRRAPRFPPGVESGPSPVLAIEELTASKFTALLTRGAPRDAFDAWQLTEAVPDLLDRSAFRVAFVVQVAGTREDLREKDPESVAVGDRAVRDELLPLLRAEARPFGGDADALAAHLNVVCRRIATSVLRWHPRERAFLDRLLDAGEIAPDLLTDDPGMQDRITAQPMLRWKAIHVRQHQGLPPMEPEEV